jgi:acyl-CoA reductase-like NAD-dependent aldehyde dehydrogenase
LSPCTLAGSAAAASSWSWRLHTPIRARSEHRRGLHRGHDHRWAHRAEEIAAGFAGSVTLGSGQFCTKPGIVFVPDVDDFLARVPDLSAGPLLNEHIDRGYLDSVEEMARYAPVGRGTVPSGAPAPVLFRSNVANLSNRPELLELEMFGPAALVVGYSDLAEVLDLVDRLPGQLTGTVTAPQNRTRRKRNSSPGSPSTPDACCGTSGRPACP